jgi:hypothetical protein
MKDLCFSINESCIPAKVLSRYLPGEGILNASNAPRRPMSCLCNVAFMDGERYLETTWHGEFGWTSR